MRKCNITFILLLAAMHVLAQSPEFGGWTFSASEALRVHKNYTLKDFRLVNANTKYVWMHLDEFMPVATVGRKGPVSSLLYTPMPEIGKVIVTNTPDSLNLEEFIRRSELQAIIVVYKGRIVYERYPRMRQV